MTAVAVTVVAGALGMIVLLAILPSRRCRVVAVLVSFGAICVFGSNTTPTALWIAVAMGCPALLAVAWYRTGLAVRPAGATLGAAALFLALVVLSSCLSGGGLPAFVPLAVALGWTATQLGSRERVAVVRGIVMIGVGEVAYAVTQAFFGVQPIWGRVASQGTGNPFVNGLDRVQASFGQAIVFGLFCAVTALLVWTDAARLHRGLRVVVFGFLVGGLFLSGTRSAVLALLLAIAVHALLRPNLLKWVRNVTAALLGVALVALLDFGVRSITTEALDSGSWLQRIGSMRSVPRLLSRTGFEFWFGSGFGSEQELYRTGLVTSPYHFTVIDNFYVYTLGTMGLLGVAMLLAVFVIGFTTSGRTGRGTIVILAVMCAAFDLLAWRSTAAVLVLFLVVDPVQRVIVRAPEDETTGEVVAVPGGASTRPGDPGTCGSSSLMKQSGAAPGVEAAHVRSVRSPQTAGPAFRPPDAAPAHIPHPRRRKRRHGDPT